MVRRAPGALRVWVVVEGGRIGRCVVLADDSLLAQDVNRG